MEELINSIIQLGNLLVSCQLNCAGICNNRENGIIPRCLYLEYQNRQVQEGCVIVGINPGRGSNNNAERNYYTENGINYNSVINYWSNPNNHNQGQNHPYYVKLRNFVDLMGFNGPILWTELIKCENNNGINLPPLQTFRSCINHYLTQELALVPNWPIIAVGKETHKALSFLYLNRPIMGVPHPTGAGGIYFNRLFTDNNRAHFVDTIQNQINNFMHNGNVELWLNPQH